MILLSHKIKFSVLATAFAFLFFCSNESVIAQRKLLRFKDYPVAEVYKGKNAQLKLKHGEYIERDRLEWAIDNQSVDFAGHYIITNWSCGMWCSDSAVIDAKTGKNYGWNGSLSVCFPDLDKDFNCNENFSNIEYRIDSKLIVFFGSRKDDGDRGFHYYKFENGRFIHLKSILVKEQRSASQIQLDKFDEKTNKKNPEK